MEKNRIFKWLIAIIAVALIGTGFYFVVSNQQEKEKDNLEDKQKDNENQEAILQNNTELKNKIQEQIAQYTFDIEQEVIQNTQAKANIILKENVIQVTGLGVKVEGTTVTITEGGTYNISGNLKEGQIIVEVDKETKVELILANASISCENSAPLFIKSADRTTLTLEKGTKNYLIGGSVYTFASTEEEEPNATLFSKDDLRIQGNGSLTVIAGYEDGIVTKNDLEINSGTIEIIAIDDGIRGKDSVTINGGEITIEAGGDGIKSTEDLEDGKGYVIINGGNITITAVHDGVQAETDLTIYAGNINLITGGGNGTTQTTENLNHGNREILGRQDETGFPIEGQRRNEERNMENMQNNKIKPENIGKQREVQTTSSNNLGTLEENQTESTSAKGLKAQNQLTIYGGTIQINSADDAIHSNQNILVVDGKMEIETGDDAIHADTALVIDGGEFNIKKSYEGIESNEITINNGSIYIVSSDDGLNAAGGMDQSGILGSRGQDRFSTSGSANISIHGGYINIKASGDGIDANGSIIMTAGTVLVDGPTNSGNAALDYDKEFRIEGGILVATGSFGMLQTASGTSSQKVVTIMYDSIQTANTLATIVGEDGYTISYAPSKNYQSIVISTPEFKNGNYIVYVDGNNTADEKDGLYLNGNYTKGTEVESFTIEGILTTVGSNRNGMQGGTGGMGKRRQ